MNVRPRLDPTPRIADSHRSKMRPAVRAPLPKRPGFCARPAVGLVRFMLLVGLVLPGCSPAESSEDEAPVDEEPGYTLVATTGADTSFVFTVDATDSLAVFGRGRDVVIVDVVDASRPRLLGNVTLGGGVRDVVLRGEYAFAAADSAGLYVIDLSNRAAPKAVGRMRFADRAYGVDAANGRAYVAARAEGLRILDAANPTALAEIGHIITPDEAVDVVVRGDVAYVAAWYAGMRAIDVSDPASPEETGFASYDSYDNGAAWSVHVDGNLGVQAVPDMGLRTVDISDPRDVKLHKVYRGLFAPVGAAVRGSTAFVADQDAGLRILDLADPARPLEVGALDLSGPAMSVALAGDVAYVAAREAGLRIVDISRLSDPREVAYVDAFDEIVDIARTGDTLIAAGRQNGVTLHRSAETLESVGTLAGRSTRVAVHGGVLVVGSTNSIASYGLSDTATPLASVSTPGPVHGIAVNDDVVIAATGRFGLRLLARRTLHELGSFEPDRAGLATSNQVQMLRTPLAAWDVLLHGRHAIAAFDDGIRVIDVSMPSQPELTGFLRTPQRVYRVALRGSQLFAACDDGVRVIDLSDPAGPTELDFLKTPSFATALAFDEQRLYVGDLSGTLTIAAASVPLKRIRAVKVADRIYSLSVSAGGIAVASGRQGVRVVSDLLRSGDYP